MKKAFLASVFILCSSFAISPASATQRVWITEFSSLAFAAGGGMQAARLPAVARQLVDVTGGVQTSAAFNQSTNFIRVICEVQCAVRGDGVAATSNDLLMAPFGAEYFGVTPGGVISVIAAP
jgi:hypothetical protein